MLRPPFYQSMVPTGRQKFPGRPAGRRLAYKAWPFRMSGSGAMSKRCELTGKTVQYGNCA